MIAVDAHAHFHACFAVDCFLASAVRRLREASGTPGALVLTEGRGERAMETLSRVRPASGWSAEPLEGGAALRLRRRDSAEEVLLIQGRQLRTSEGLEVLGVGDVGALPDGESAARSVRAVRAAGGLPVIPWGFGKWWGRRRSVVLGCLDEVGPDELFLGDSGGRMAWPRRPSLLDLARERGFRVLSGSDPLPFANEGSRAGSFGSLLDLEIDPERPVGSLVEGLRRPDLEIAPFGRGLPPGRFVLNQVRMQWRSLRRR